MKLQTNIHWRGPAQTIFRQCQCCMEYKWFTDFPEAFLPGKEAVSNQCYSCIERFKSAQQSRKETKWKINNFFEYYFTKYKHVPPETQNSFSLYTQIQPQFWLLYLEFHNNTYKTKHTIPQIDSFIKLYKKHIWRYICVKLCHGCNTQFYTYEGADDPDFVYKVVYNPTISPKIINFRSSKTTRDGYSRFCLDCRPIKERKSLPTWFAGQPEFNPLIKTKKEFDEYQKQKEHEGLELQRNNDDEEKENPEFDF